MKTEEPTPRRLRKAREQGDSPVSIAFGQSFALVLVILLLPATLAATGSSAAELFRLALSGVSASAVPALLAREVVVHSAPVVAAAALAAIALGLVQTQGVISAGRLAPTFAKLDPVEGAKQLFRLDRLLALARALLGAGLVLVITFQLAKRHAADLVATAGNELAVLPLVGVLGSRLAWWVAAVGLGLALLDLVVVKYAWRRRHRMTKDEVRRDYREAEGDPELKARRRRAHQEALEGSLLNAVRTASVVIVNPTHLACALRYDEAEDAAPKIVAQGQGELARRITDAARAYGVPCVRDVPVARALAELEIGDEIPEALYEAVAEILRTLIDDAEREPSETL